MSYLNRAKKWLLGTFLVYAVLVSTNLGEFWPFSIYPMFSQAGNPWVRAVVREIPDADAGVVSWEPTSRDMILGRPFAVGPTGINQNDVANFVSKSREWTPRRTEALRRLFHTNLTDRTLLIYRVTGELGDNRSISVRYEPYILMTPDTTILHPEVSP